MTSPTAQGFETFWDDVTAVNKHVQDELANGMAPDLQKLTTSLWTKCGSGIRDRTLVFAQQLLDELAERPVGDFAIASGEFPKWFLNYFHSRACPVGASDPGARIYEFLMEQLTAVWLVLYFVSVPMGHPWERVRRIADEQGGYPSGACMTKLIGDVYRQSRLEYLDLQAEHKCPSAPHVLVLSMYPSLLIQSLLTRPDTKKITPSELHQLGRCYALYQLRLYVSEERSIRYIVTLAALKESWDLCSPLPPLKSEDGARFILNWLHRIFPYKPVQGQEVLLHCGKENLNLSACVLGRKTGVYTPESGTDERRLVGNKASKMLLHSMRNRLINEASPDLHSLLGMSTAKLSKTLAVYCT
jgi:hypothetical protein